MKFLDQLKESLQSIWSEIAASVPKVLGAIVAILIALLVIRLILNIVKRTLKFLKVDRLDDKLNEIDLFGGKKFNFSIIDIAVKFLKWVLYLLLILLITDILELTMVSDGLKSLLNYLPNLFTSLAIFILGLLFANFVKKSLQSFFDSMDLSGGKIISQIVFMMILTFISITALNQAGVDTEIVTSSITMILAAFALAFALALGLGAQKIVGELLKTFYTRKAYELGQHVEFKNIKGVIDSIDGLTITIKTDKEKIVVPIKDIVESQVKIQD